MKLIKIYPFFILLSINLFSYADSKVGLTPKIDEENIYSFNLPKVGKIKVSVHLSECFDALCDTSLELSWQKDNKTITKKLIEDGYPVISKIQGDENGLIVSSSGNRYNSDEYRNHVRYRYSQDKKTFYSAKIWDTDSLWNPYIKKLDDNLAQGSFAKARALVLKHGTSRNAGHYYESQMFFSKFVDAELREARRAWLDGHTETATHFITALTNKIPFYNHSNSLSKGEAYFFQCRIPTYLKPQGIIKNYSICLKQQIKIIK